ncbi:MAG: hypothetical protein AB8G15_15895 [Saprospiraceae bacterium]
MLRITLFVSFNVGQPTKNGGESLLLHYDNLTSHGVRFFFNAVIVEKKPVKGSVIYFTRYFVAQKPDLTQKEWNFSPILIFKSKINPYFVALSAQVYTWIRKMLKLRSAGGKETFKHARK